MFVQVYTNLHIYTERSYYERSYYERALVLQCHPSYNTTNTLHLRTSLPG